MLKNLIDKKRKINNLISVILVFCCLISNAQIDQCCGDLLLRKKKISDFENKLELLNCLIKNQGNTNLSIKWLNYLNEKNGEKDEKISTSPNFLQNKNLTTVQLTSLFLFNAIIDDSLLNKSEIILCDGENCTSNVKITKYEASKSNNIDFNRKIYLGYKYQIEKNKLIKEAYKKCNEWLIIANKKGIKEAGKLELIWK